MSVSPVSRNSVRLFLIAMALSALLVPSVGWLTGLRDAMHTALISVALLAFFPFAVIASGILLGLVGFAVSMLTSMLGDSGSAVEPNIGAPVVRAGAKLMSPYYRWLASRRHPVFWGLPAGCLVGGIVLWGFIAIWIIPRETVTAESLARIQQLIDRKYSQDGRYPPADPDGQLQYAVLGLSEPGVVVDAFGNPVAYHVAGRWLAASYQLRSYGFDGKRSGDDLCYAGATKLARVAALLPLPGGERATLSDRLGAIREMRCSEQRPSRN
jgi:hypothetical protein